MNIWLISAYDQPNGASSRTFDVAQQLVRNGHVVTMFTNSYCHWSHVDLLKNDEHWKIEIISGIRIVWLKTIHYNSNGMMRAFNMLSNMYRSIQCSYKLNDLPHVVLGPSVPLGTGLAAYYIAKKTQAVFIFEIRDVWPARLVYDGSISKFSFTYLIFRIIEKYLYRKADGITTVLPFVHDHVQKSICKTKKISWVPNGVNISKIDQYIPYNGGVKNYLTVMYVGGMSYVHGISTILKAAELLDMNEPDKFRFIIVGDGVNKKNFEDEARMLNLKNIEFRPFVKKSDLPKVISEADVLIASVLKSESYKFGINFNKIFDYLSSGRPVLLACSSPNDPISESSSGFTIEPENPILMANILEKLCKLSPADRVMIGRNGPKYIKDHHDIKTIISKLENFIQDIIQEKERGFGT